MSRCLGMGSWLSRWWRGESPRPSTLDQQSEGEDSHCSETDHSDTADSGQSRAETGTFDQQSHDFSFPVPSRQSISGNDSKENANSQQKLR